MFEQQFNLSPDRRVLDVGGYPFNWSLIPVKPQLFYVNLHEFAIQKNNEQLILADGRFLPFKNESIDIGYSNSVIEHLGNFESQHLFATECKRVGKSYYVQTPNRRFPIEPHLITPFIHWLPRDVQKRLLRYFTVWGLVAKPSRQERDQFMNTTCLLSEKELRELFPEAEIWYERVVGLKKSLMAVRLPG